MEGPPVAAALVVALDCSTVLMIAAAFGHTSVNLTVDAFDCALCASRKAQLSAWPVIGWAKGRAEFPAACIA